MSILDDFFGDSETAVKECLHCGGKDGNLIVAISDNDGPTHWKHAECANNHTRTGFGSPPAFGDAIADADGRDE